MERKIRRRKKKEKKKTGEKKRKWNKDRTKPNTILKEWKKR
jgi:hypothetical protein